MAGVLTHLQRLLDGCFPVLATCGIRRLGEAVESIPFHCKLLADSSESIENTLHYRRDVSLGEDACQTRDFTGAWPAGSTQ